MVGGMITATVLTLLVIPAIYLLWRRWQVRRGPEAIVRLELLDAVVCCVKQAGVPRLTVERVHALDSGRGPGLGEDLVSRGIRVCREGVDAV